MNSNPQSLPSLCVGARSQSSGVEAYSQTVTLHRNGSVTAWGRAAFGGSAPSLSQVASVTANSTAFVARHENGTVSAWGVAEEGGAIPDELAGELHDIQVVYGCSQIFIALRADGRVFAWGNPSQLPDAQALQAMQQHLSYFE